jgi:hypothetical protein
MKYFTVSNRVNNVATVHRSTCSSIGGESKRSHRALSVAGSRMASMLRFSQKARGRIILAPAATA